MNQQHEEEADQVTIDRVEMGTGWVLFPGGATPPSPDQIAYYLNDAMCDWLGKNPEFKVRTTLPIIVEGNTVALNIWFD